MNRKSFRAKRPVTTGADRVRIRPEMPPETTLATIGTFNLDSGPPPREAVAMKPHAPENTRRPTSAQTFQDKAETWLAVISAAGLAGSTVDCYRRDLRDFEQAVTFLFGHAAGTEDIGRINQAGIDAVV